MICFYQCNEKGKADPFPGKGHLSLEDDELC